MDLPAQLRGAQRQGPPRAHAGRGPGADLFGGGDYSMRAWLDPQKVARARPVGQRRRGRHPRPERAGRGRRGGRVAGPAGHRPAAVRQRAGPAAERVEEFGDIIVKTGAGGEVTRLRDLARMELGASRIRAALAAWTTSPPSRHRRSSRPRAATRCTSPTACAPRWKELKARPCPRAWTTASSTTRRSSCARPSSPSSTRCWRPSRSWCWSSSCSCRPGARPSSRCWPCRCPSSAPSP